MASRTALAETAAGGEEFLVLEIQRRQHQISDGRVSVARNW